MRRRRQDAKSQKPNAKSQIFPHISVLVERERSASNHVPIDKDADAVITGFQHLRYLPEKCQVGFLASVLDVLFHRVLQVTVLIGEGTTTVQRGAARILDAHINGTVSIRGGDVQYKSDLKVEADSTQRKPRVLFVGDSFIWGLDNNLPAEELVESRDVWFYNKTAFEGFKNTMSKVNEINRLRHILKADYVVFYLVGHQWWKATCGFATDALKLFNQATEAEILEARQMNAIEFDEEWLSQLKVYASQHGIALEEALRGEADNVLENKALFREGIVVDTAILIQMKKEEIIKKWRNSPDQMRMFEQKAKDRKLTVEEMLEKDAQWVVDRKMEKGELF